MSWFQKLIPSKKKAAKKGKGIPEGLWTKCLSCNSFLFQTELERNLMVCPKCNYHMRISARKRLDQFLDPKFRFEIAKDLSPVDRLKFRDTKKYKDRISAARRRTSEKEALVVIRGKINGIDIVSCAFEFGFIGGSMGSVVGEKFVQAVNRALEEKIPLVCFASSGGARMQESLFSLMQMAKTSAALGKLAEKKLPYISILVDPCTGGVSASLAMLGDLNIAEPNALIGFAGPRVIEQTVREVLPEGFQRSSFLLEKGAIDMIVDRRKMKEKITNILLKMLHK